MHQSLIVVASLVVLASGCGHANLPTLPASHGELSRRMDRYLDDVPEPDSLIEGVAAAPMHDPTTPRVLVEPAQAPTVLAEALRVLEGDPTREQVLRTLAYLAGACRAPFPPACDAIRERWENPKRLSIPQYALPSSAAELKAATVVVVQCKLTTRGETHGCQVVESAPYDITPVMLDAASRATFWPAYFADEPIAVSYTFHFHIPRNPEPLTPAQELAWARARTVRFPASASAWAHLARALAKYFPEDPAYPEALRQLHALVPHYWWSANELAWHHAQAGRYSEAEATAKTAWQEQPRNPYVLETFAAVSAGMERCAEAVAYQRQAVAAVPKKWPAPERERFQRTLETYLQKCPEAGPVPVAAARH